MSCAIFCDAEKARTVIEIGLSYGGSALVIAEGLVANGSCQGCHLIIDAFQNQLYVSGWNEQPLRASLSGLRPRPGQNREACVSEREQLFANSLTS